MVNSDKVISRMDRINGYTPDEIWINDMPFSERRAVVSLAMMNGTC